MANGFQGTKKGWQRITEPLERLDKRLEKFASDNGLPLAVNVKGWPNREYRWTYGIERLISIYLENEKHLTWSFWICAYKIGDDSNFVKHETLLKDVSIDEIDNKLESLLQEAYDKVCSWEISDLSKANGFKIVY